MTYAARGRSSFHHRAALAVGMLCLALTGASAQEKAGTKGAGQAPDGQPPVQYQAAPNPAGQYPAYKPPQYPAPPQYPPNGQYPYSQYPAAKFPKDQYRGSQQDQQACIGDVFRLCNQSVPDVTRIVACLQSNKRNLSPPCRAVFGRGAGARKSHSGAK